MRESRTSVGNGELSVTVAGSICSDELMNWLAQLEGQQKMAKESTRVSEKKDFCSRRRFVAKSAVATAGFVIVKPSVVRGFGANSRIEVGCIGLGGRGRLIAGMLAEHEGFQVTSAVDYFSKVVQAVGENLGVAKERRFCGLSEY
ncbi:MAG: hypothetical protein PVJ86_06085, partial [Phycisphaerales bacterium]